MRKNKKDTSEEDYDKLRAEVIRLRKELRQEKMRTPLTLPLSLGGQPTSEIE